MTPSVGSSLILLESHSDNRLAQGGRERDQPIVQGKTTRPTPHPLALQHLLLILLVAGVKADLLDFQLFRAHHGGIDGGVSGAVELQQVDLSDTENNAESGIEA